MLGAVKRAASAAVLLLILSLHVLVVAGWTHGNSGATCWTPDPTNNNWTKQCGSATNEYIALATGGNDSTCAVQATAAAAEAAPCATAAKAGSLMGTGPTHAPQVLVNRGNTFPNDSFGQICSDGLSTSQPASIITYGSGARPIIQVSPTSGVGLDTDGGGCHDGGGNLVIIGIAFYNISADPGAGASFKNTIINASVSGTTLTVNSTTSGALANSMTLTDPNNLLSGPTITFVSGSTWTLSSSQGTIASEKMRAQFAVFGIHALNTFTSFLIEDCSFQYFGVGIDIEVQGTQGSGLVIRRTQVLDSYFADLPTNTIAEPPFRSQGIYLNNVVFTAYENLLDNNGWNATADGGGANEYNHSFYVEDNPGTLVGLGTVAGNIISNDSIGSKFDAGTVQGNSFIRDPYGHNICQQLAITATLVNYNLHTEQINNTVNGGAGTAFDTINTVSNSTCDKGTLTISNNLIAHTGAGVSNSGGIVIDSLQTGTSVLNNIICDWVPESSNLIVDHDSSTITSNQAKTSNCNNTATWNDGLGNTISTPSFPAPTSTVGSYDTSISDPTCGANSQGTTANFICNARLNNKANWANALTAPALNGYMFTTGFGVSYPYSP